MILEAKNILYSYKSKRDKNVLNNVSAIFEESTFYAIVGSSGSGKTTFLSLLAGLDNPVSGSILYSGEDIRKKGLNYHRRHNVSLVFQNYNLIDYLTTEENVKLGGTKNAEDLLQKVSIPREDWKRNVLQLSGGQQQRVAIARALVGEPSLILADEPTGNLDSRSGKEIMMLLHNLYEEGNTIVLITHDNNVAMEAPRQVQISDGKIIKDSGGEAEYEDHTSN